MKNLDHVWIRKMVNGKDYRLSYLRVSDDWGVVQYIEDGPEVYELLCRGDFKRCFAYFSRVAKIDGLNSSQVEITINVI